MAGHSKWANIKHRKAAQDAKWGKVFTKLIRELVLAAKAGGPNIEDNPRLRTAVDKALGSNMKRDTVDKAIARGVGAGEGDNYDEITYEGYAPGGVAVLVECMTDNRNRTVSEVRHAFSKHNGNMGTSGSVSYLFTKLGIFNYESGVDEDRLMEVALELGADDIVSEEDGSMEVICQADTFLDLQAALNNAELTPSFAEIEMRASTMAEVSEKDAEKIINLIDALEELDDVQNVYSNVEFPDGLLENLG